jgi:hypothetical protein
LRKTIQFEKGDNLSIICKESVSFSRLFSLPFNISFYIQTLFHFVLIKVKQKFLTQNQVWWGVHEFAVEWHCKNIKEFLPPCGGHV